MAVPSVASAQPSGNAEASVDQAMDPGAAQQLAWLARKADGARDRPHHFLLLLRFALLNLLGFALLVAAYVHGLIDLAIQADRTYLSAVISAIFLGGLALCARRIWQTSRELNALKAFDPLERSRVTDYLVQIRGRSGESRGIIATALRLKLVQRISIVRHVAGSLVLLGLIGTVIGFIIALSGVKPEQASDVNAISPMVSTLIAGMSTALYTTLVGSVLNVWLMMNYQLLASGTAKLIAGLLEFGEQHASA